MERSLKKQLQRVFQSYSKNLSKFLIIGLTWSLFGVPTSAYFEEALGLKGEGGGGTFEELLFPLAVALGFALLMFLMMVIYGVIASRQDESLGNVLKLALKKYVWVLIAFGLMGLSFVGGAVLLIIPGILFLVWFALAPVIVINEEVSIFEAFKLSKTMVKTNWFYMAGRLLVMMVVFFFMNGFVGGYLLQFVEIPLFVEQMYFNGINALLVFPLIFLLWNETYRSLKA